MKALLEKALRVCDNAEIYQRDVLSSKVSIRLGEMQSIESEKKTEVSLRIVKEGNMGAAIATTSDDETLIERALISLENQKSEAQPFSSAPYKPVQCASDRIKHMTTQAFVDYAFELSNRFKAKAPDIAMGVEAEKTIKTVKMINSLGFEGAYDYTNFSIVLYTLTQQGFYGVTKEFSLGDTYEVTDDQLDRLIHLHRLDDNRIALENEKMPVIFSGTVMGSLMLRVIGGVSGGNVTKNVSPIAGKIGEKLFSEKLTIRDDATLSYGCNSFAFDDEGTPAQNTVLYEKGVLTHYLTSIGQAAKLGVSPTGNAIKRTLFSKEIEDAPAVFDTNLIIEGEQIPDADVLSKVKRGLYITGVMGAHTGNINDGEFSMNISSGFLIENGELVGKVKGSMIAGNIYDLFKNIEAIGTEREVMRSIFYHMGYSPMVLFSEVNIIGK